MVQLSTLDSVSRRAHHKIIASCLGCLWRRHQPRPGRVCCVDIANRGFLVDFPEQGAGGPRSLALCCSCIARVRHRAFFLKRFIVAKITVLNSRSRGGSGRVLHLRLYSPFTLWGMKEFWTNPGASRQRRDGVSVPCRKT